MDEFVEGRSIGAFHLNVVLWPLLVTIADGFDLVVMGYAAPEIIKILNFDRSAMGVILSSSLVGMLIGTPIAGYLGDRFGRKPLIVLSTLLFGLATCSTVLAASVAQFCALRFVAGVGLAGIIPNATALVSEFIPRRVRGAFLIVVQLGVQIGGIVPGLVAAYLVSRYGWEVLFHIGGAAPVVLATVLVFVLPESIKYLSLVPSKRAELLRIARALDPRGHLPDDAVFALKSTGSRGALSPLVPLRNGMHIITPLLWLLAVVNLFTTLLMASWAPTVLRDIGLSPEAAALTATLFGLGGLIGSFMLTVGFNRYGFLVIVAFYIVAIPSMALIGQPFVDRGVLPWLVLVTGICVAGTQSAINSAFGMLYPTTIRSNCVGWGMAIGRLGAIGGPLFGGFLMSKQLSGTAFFETAALPLVFGVLIAGVLTYACRQRFGGWTLDERAKGEA
ncbi:MULTISPECIES: MFS transporter [Bradyrhizobium]|uniref:MFS transporter n=1 Tax=Bradyrhizobium zhengyangense TaxID=2911009 RepID=A0A9X1R8Q8_9BRAD|nr:MULTISPECIES: MFS transporter [Bradyrhizobium]MCG2629377.1 MFS transporter [Bradyrhizobium zhengyangense]MCG2644658.1 MFS transporter [Bradyrhizobium zhengyangense]MCG2670891.1 MFS transporter [Bradyrhizobium zhengyangense]MDN4984524.1 MFS transporter [Bradyrhizobium sp. WYCCWR 13022]MDN5002516.1 MFS transporter [Bradyrhizobium sp. WYCCWR 12677]